MTAVTPPSAYRGCCRNSPEPLQDAGWLRSPPALHECHCGIGDGWKAISCIEHLPALPAQSERSGEALEKAAAGAVCTHIVNTGPQPPH
jgi:hypothetical protein